ncbi:MAG TPA: methyltransferase domain-containing protein [Methylomirabilota bacterium]|nr:methyltransferase domain-containing protein [Methylomirabilota bacterium]
MTAAQQLSSEADLFEFRALAEARKYRRALIQSFCPFLRGNVLEVGAGIGQLTEELLQVNGVEAVMAVEPNALFASQISRVSPRLTVLQGTAADVRPDRWNAVVSVNVLEHIEDDEAELRRYAELLRIQRGALCLFVPARPELYAPIDKVFGHYRRYTRAELRGKLEGAGFQVLQLNYKNLVGYFGWWLTFKVKAQTRMLPGQVRVFDRWIFPAANRLEEWLGPAPFGQSLLAVCRAG